jgi:hypothetical protein
MWPSSFGKTVSGPETVLDRKPGEKTTLRRGLGLPNDVAERAWEGRHELSFVLENMDEKHSVTCKQIACDYLPLNKNETKSNQG